MSNKQDNNSDVKQGTLQLREEQLDISKERIKTGEVSMHKESYTEEKTITVPVVHEELVIEKRILGQEAETIRIPIKEERIEIVKHPVALEDVSYYINQYETTKHIEETLKREKLHIETDGDIEVIDKDQDQFPQFS